MKKFTIAYEEIISSENLLAAWQEFIRGKRYRRDVLAYERFFVTNLLKLHGKLVDGTYRHGEYTAFTVSDPKTRHIHKATVEDRIVHRALYRALYRYFDRRFVIDSYSCREGKGTHLALARFATLARRASRNHQRTLWVLQCDIRKFFASIDQAFLLRLLGKSIDDGRLLGLVGKVVGSFTSGVPGKGLPLGNLTSQLFANIYMNELDQFMKHCLKARHYIRYADDFVVMSHDKSWLHAIRAEVEEFLARQLRLSLHPDKVHVRTLASGVDFLGWVHFPNHRVLRTTTKLRMLRRLAGPDVPTETMQSYLGLLSHGNAEKLCRRIELNDAFRIRTVK